MLLNSNINSQSSKLIAVFNSMDTLSFWNHYLHFGCWDTSSSGLFSFLSSWFSQFTMISLIPTSGCLGFSKLFAASLDSLLISTLLLFNNSMCYQLPRSYPSITSESLYPPAFVTSLCECCVSVWMMWDNMGIISNELHCKS